MSKYKPGEIVTIKGTEFAVLNIEKGTANGKDKLFVLLKDTFGFTLFSTNGNDYAKSNLRDKVEQWYSKFASDLDKELIFQRGINLLTMDGRANYGIVDCLAGPLTFDEWRKYSRYIPDCERGYWLATGDGAPGRLGATGALGVNSGGDWYSNDCWGSYAVRPALVVSEELIDTPKDEGLSKYSTMELLQELVERAKMDVELRVTIKEENDD